MSVKKGAVMRYGYLLIMFCVIPFIKGMELPRNSMLSIVIPIGFDKGIIQSCIPQEIQQCIGLYVLDKQEWWYVAKIFKHDNYVNSVCFDNSGNQLATGSRDNKARIFDLIANKLIASFSHDNYVNSVCFNNSGNLLATGSFDKTARIFDLKTNKLIDSFDGHNGWVVSVCFNNSGNLLATGSFDKTARIFDLNANKLITSFKHDNFVNAVCFNNSGNLLATGSYDNIARIFTRYTDQTFNQILLKKIITLWLCVEKPHKDVQSVELLLKKLASMFNVNFKELEDTWKTFPEGMQLALWRTIAYRIEKYGK